MGHKKEKIPLKMTKTQRRSLERFLMKKNIDDLSRIVVVDPTVAEESHTISLCGYDEIIGSINSGYMEPGVKGKDGRYRPVFSPFDKRTIKKKVEEIKKRRAAWWRKNKKW